MASPTDSRSNRGESAPLGFGSRRSHAGIGETIDRRMSYGSLQTKLRTNVRDHIDPSARGVLRTSHRACRVGDLRRYFTLPWLAQPSAELPAAGTSFGRPPTVSRASPRRARLRRRSLPTPPTRRARARRALPPPFCDGSSPWTRSYRGRSNSPAISDAYLQQLLLHRRLESEEGSVNFCIARLQQRRIRTARQRVNEPHSVRLITEALWLQKDRPQGTQILMSRTQDPETQYKL